MTRADSFFFYPDDGARGRHKRQSYADYQNSGFVPVFLDELTFTEEQRIACEDNRQCLFDLAVTGSMDFANNTLMEDKIANATKEVLSKCIVRIGYTIQAPI